MNNEKENLLTLDELLRDYNLLEEFHSHKIDMDPNLFHKHDGIHGVTHAERVLFLVLAISHMEDISKEDKEILISAAKYHDIGRGHDSTCFDHGVYSYKKMKKMGLLNETTPEDEELIKYIVENHCIDDEAAYDDVKNYDIRDSEHAMYLLDMLKDADNLDRVRIKDLDISYLRTNSAKRLVPIAYELLKMNF